MTSRCVTYFSVSFLRPMMEIDPANTLFIDIVGNCFYTYICFVLLHLSSSTYYCTMIFHSFSSLTTQPAIWVARVISGGACWWNMSEFSLCPAHSHLTCRLASLFTYFGVSHQRQQHASSAFHALSWYLIRITHLSHLSLFFLVSFDAASDLPWDSHAV
jgi:hypothetical protein